MEVLWMHWQRPGLVVMLWDIHRGVAKIAAIADEVHQSTQDIHAKTDELLRACAAVRPDMPRLTKRLIDQLEPRARSDIVCLG